MTTSQKMPDLQSVLPPILDAVVETWRIPQGSILAKSRTPRVCEARHAFCWLARRHTPYSLPVIAAFLAGRDHGTISNSTTRALELWETDPDFRKKLEAAEGMIAPAQSQTCAKALAKDDLNPWRIVEGAVLNARNHGTGLSPRWVAVRNSLGVGMTTAYALCRRFGLNPDDLIANRR